MKPTESVSIQLATVNSREVRVDGVLVGVLLDNNGKRVCYHSSSYGESAFDLREVFANERDIDFVFIETVPPVTKHDRNCSSEIVVDCVTYYIQDLDDNSERTSCRVFIQPTSISELQPIGVAIEDTNGEYLAYTNYGESGETKVLVGRAKTLERVIRKLAVHAHSGISFSMPVGKKYAQSLSFLDKTFTAYRSAKYLNRIYVKDCAGTKIGYIEDPSVNDGSDNQNGPFETYWNDEQVFYAVRLRDALEHIAMR